MCVCVCGGITSVLCTSDSVPSSFTLKISRKGSDLLKKSFREKTLQRLPRYVILPHRSFTHSLNCYLTSFPAPFYFVSSIHLSCSFQFIHHLPAAFHNSLWAQLVWISHPWPCAWELKINMVICYCGRVLKIKWGYCGGGVPTYLSGPPLRSDCTISIMLAATSSDRTTRKACSTHFITSYYLKRNLKFELMNTGSRTNLVVQLPSAEWELDVIVISRQLLCCHLIEEERKKDGESKGGCNRRRNQHQKEVRKN